MDCRSDIRRATAGDLDAVESIERASFGASGDAFSRRQLRYLMLRARGGCFVAETGGRVVGYMALLHRAHLANVRIYSVAVATEFRGCGAGQALVERALAEAGSCGARYVTLEVSVTNTAAQALYRKNGFVPVGRIAAYYHDGTDAWRMRREI